ncbi:hypothetical protein [Brevundimonas sp. CEF1]|uniref:hypothetical protein n=1 Tax=Brevundimonas sp. CEF1 TaxID=3442642 RepID=UPI003F5153E0
MLVRFNSAAIENRPAIGAAMMVVVIKWSELEHRWGILLAEILGAEAAAGVAMFNAVENESSRRHLLTAASNKRLSLKYREEMDALINDVRKGAKLRNDIAHGQWGAADNDPDGVVLGDGRSAGEGVARSHAVEHGIETLLGSAKVPPMLMRYDIRDFQQEAARIDILIGRQIALTASIRAHREAAKAERNLIFGVLDAVEQNSLP